jgi:hypothetical protein
MAFNLFKFYFKVFLRNLFNFLISLKVQDFFLEISNFRKILNFNLEILFLQKLHKYLSFHFFLDFQDFYYL